MINNILGNNNRVINKYSSIISQINDLENDFKSLSDDELANKTEDAYGVEILLFH